MLSPPPCQTIVMAHGNASDLVFLFLLGGAIQGIFFSHLLFVSIGPLKATFANDVHQVEVESMCKFAGGLCLILGAMFSGVKWNPINGKMGGIGCFLCAINSALVGLSVEGSGLFFFVNAAVISMGGINIFAFYSNPPTPKSDKTKNNHGNLSDFVFLILLIGAVQSIFYPDMLTENLGKVKATFSTPSADLSAMISFTGGLFLPLGAIFSGVKWNPINGKMAGVACLLMALNSGVIASHRASYGSGAYFIFYSIVLFIGGLHILAFPANELPVYPKDQKVA